MRHFWTLIAALVIAPLAWFLLAFGQATSLKVLADDNTATPSGGEFVRPLVFLAAAGLLLGLFATLQTSPVGAVVTGILYAASYVMLLVAPHAVLSALSKEVSFGGLRADLSTPVRTGTSALLGAMMLLALISVRRWRRRSEWEDSGDSWATSSTSSSGFPARRPSAGTLAGWTSFLRDDSATRPFTRNR
jgi:hypothetical protein